MHSLPIEDFKKYIPGLLAYFETALIVIGLGAMWYWLPRRIFSDGDLRLFAVIDLINHGKISSMGYSLIGPLFSVPMLLLGKFDTRLSMFWLSGQYNKILLALTMLVIYLVLKDHVDRRLLRIFFLVLIVASMFGNNVTYFAGETFTACCVAIGTLLVMFGPGLVGWLSIALGVANTPATLVAMGTLALTHMFQSKRWRAVLALVAAGALILGVNWLQHGSPFRSGYEGQTFSTPFFMGLISILFSFGKGLIFFVPGLLLPIKYTLLSSESEGEAKMYAVYLQWLSFVVGLILVYSAWWAWDGGWFWGPRFFLFASIPASFALAIRLLRPATSLLIKLLTLVVFALSVWVGINGAIYSYDALSSVCTGFGHDYSHYFLCQYVPSFSTLWYPFIVYQRLDRSSKLYILYSLVVAVYLVLPLLVAIARHVWELGRTHLRLALWHF